MTRCRPCRPLPTAWNPPTVPSASAICLTGTPDLPDVDPDDHTAYEARLLELRSRAVHNALAMASIDGLRKLAEHSPVPSQLGWVAGAVAPEDLTPGLLTWLDSENPKLRETASTWASRKLQDHGAPWLVEALARPE